MDASYPNNPSRTTGTDTTTTNATTNINTNINALALAAAPVREGEQEVEVSARARARGGYKCGECGFFPKKDVHDCNVVKEQMAARAVLGRFEQNLCLVVAEICCSSICHWDS
jgi:hypothetical protein